MTSPSAVVARAEEDAHVEEEMRRVKLPDAPQTLEDVQRLVADDAGSNVGGVESSAEMMTVYNRSDGVPSEITTDQAGQRLRVRFEKGHPMAGQLVWTTKPPSTAPASGRLLCPLHPDSEERAYLNGLHYEGKTCQKSTMKTLYDRDMHFEKGHPAIFKAVEKDRARQLQVQQMELMKEQTAAMQAMAAANGAPPASGNVFAEAPAPAEAPSVTDTTPAGSTDSQAEVRCDACEEVIEGKLAAHRC